MTLRTYAIYDRSSKVLVLVGSLGLMVPAIGIVGVSYSGYNTACRSTWFAQWISVTLTAGSHTAQSDSPIPL
jgi:hypothetical protein